MLLTALFALSAEAAAGPTQLGRVFERRHSAVVAVRVKATWRAGFVIGGRGEVVLGGRSLPERFEVRTADGALRWARRLAVHPRWPLTVARVEAWDPRPLDVGPAVRFRKEMWAMVMSVNASGQPEPFAGVFTENARRRKPTRLMSTAQLGSAILDLDGRLVGVAVTQGGRETSVIGFSTLKSFVIDAAATAPESPVGGD